MKRLLIASLAIFCSFSCKKILPVVPAKTATGIPATPSVMSGLEDLGAAMKGSNVFWKIHPSGENMEPLITYAPNSNSGYVAVVIDNGNRTTAPLKFIAVNLQTNTTKTVIVKDKNGMPVTSSLGRIIRYKFGMNKKYYVATENGGHLIEYDPNTQTAVDLGQPFNVGGKVLDIYSLNVGKDGALYGGSFGGNGDVYTFRYNYNGQFYVDKTSLDGEAKYVTYVAADEKYTYASCGQNSWKLIAINRATGTKEVLIRSSNPADRIYLSTNTDACYGQVFGKNYKLSGGAAEVLSIGRVASAQLEYSPYLPSDPTLPKIAWSECDKKLYYRFPGSTEKVITLNDVTDETYSVNAMTAANGKLFLTGGKVPRMMVYDKQTGFTCVGTPSINVYFMTPVPGTGGTKLVMGGYPKGALLEYRTNQSWTMGTETISYTPPEVTSSLSNPSRFVQLQDADNAGVYGPMTINGIVYTKDGTLIAAGNNDRLTYSGSRELAIGTYKNGVKRNFTIPDFGNYEFASMCLSKDSSEVLISAVSKAGNGKIFRYNPISNSIVSSIPFAYGASPGNIQMYSSNLMIGASDEFIYMVDINTKKVVYKKDFATGERVYSFAIAPDNSVWVCHFFVDGFRSKIEKVQFNTADLTAVTAAMSEVMTFKNPDNDEATKPSGLLFTKSGNTNTYDLYISGFRSLCRINNACTVI